MKIDYASLCFSALFVIICFYALVAAVKWTLWALGVSIELWQFALVFGVLYCVVVGFIMYIGMRAANIKKLYNNQKDMENDRK